MSTGCWHEQAHFQRAQCKRSAGSRNEGLHSVATTSGWLVCIPIALIAGASNSQATFLPASSATSCAQALWESPPRTMGFDPARFHGAQFIRASTWAHHRQTGWCKYNIVVQNATGQGTCLELMRVFASKIVGRLGWTSIFLEMLGTGQRVIFRSCLPCLDSGMAFMCGRLYT